MTDQAAVSPHRHGDPGSGTISREFGPKFNGPLGVLICSVLFLVAFLIALIGSVTSTEALSLPGAFGVVVFGIGAAPLQPIRRLDIYARLTGASLLGLSVVLGIGALMADVRPLWHPVPAAVVVGLITVVLHVRGLQLARPGIAVALRPAIQEWRAEARGASRTVRVSLALTAAGTLLWLIPALSTHVPEPGVWGFLPVISRIWYLGVILIVLGFALGRRSETCAVLSTLAFGLASTVTPGLIYATPRDGAAAKQMLITQAVITHHHIVPPAGIYQAYSALFSGMAWLCSLLHIHGMLGSYSLLGLGTFWPALVLVPRILALRLFAGRLLETPGRRWSAVMLVLLVDTINDANYFSPQSVAYLLSIGTLAFVVFGVQPRPLGRRATFWLLLAVGMALAPTHELTPYLTAAALFVLALFGQATWWTCLPVGVPALLWAGVVRNAVGANFSFGQLFDISNLVPPKTVGVPGLVRSPVIGYQSHALLLALLILIGLGALGFFANIRTRWAWGYALCPVVGIGLILVNPYGNEGIFRASLFAIPWMAVLALHMPQPGRILRVLSRPALLTAGVMVVLLGLLGTFVVAEWGIDGTSVLLRSDVSVTQYLKSRPPRKAVVMSLGAAGDTIVNYPDFLVNYKTADWETVATRKLLNVKHPTPTDLVALTDSFGAVAVGNGATYSSPLYIFWSYSTVIASAAYAVQSPTQMNGWLKLLKSSRVWRVADRSGDTYLFELRR